MAKRLKQPSTPSCNYPGALLNCPDFTLTTVSYLISELMQAALDPFELNMREYRLLRILSADGPQRQSALGAQLAIDRTTAVGLVDDLERKGYAKRERAKEDRRAYLISLTAKGKRTIAKAISAVSKTERKVFDPLHSREKEELQRLVRALLTESGPIAEQHRRAFQSLIRRSNGPEAALKR
jgi:DNA-binding MarR family transcriptional regulator